MKFGEKLDRLIRRSGKMQKEIAAEIGIRPTLISKWKSGVPPEMASVRKIADYFKVSVAMLADDESDLDWGVVEEGHAPHGKSSDSVRVAELERRIEEHRTIAKVFVARKWALPSVELLTSKDLIAGYERDGSDASDRPGHGGGEHHPLPRIGEGRQSA